MAVFGVGQETPSRQIDFDTDIVLIDTAHIGVFTAKVKGRSNREVMRLATRLFFLQFHYRHLLLAGVPRIYIEDLSCQNDLRGHRTIWS